MLADALPANTGVQLVTRPRSDLGAVAPAKDKVVVLVRTVSAAATQRLGDDQRERRGTKGHYQLQTSLHLEGQVAIDCTINADGGNDLELRRPALMQALDRILVALQAENVRTGPAFQTGDDLGFEIVGFRLVRVEPPAENPGTFAALRAIYAFSGRFWPVEAPLAGRHITTPLTRLAVLPVVAPERVMAAAGGADVTIPLRIDLRTLGGASAVVATHLEGTSPPGSLVGGTTQGVPDGWRGFTLDDSGVAAIVYRPPAAVAGIAVVQVAATLCRASEPSVPLAGITIEVH
jgi:hypothetical protein